MNKLIILLVFSLFISANSVFAQSMINGEISDEADNAKLENATIMLIQAKDSILVDFTRSDGTGKFQLKKPTAGDYVLIISYPKFGDYYSPIQGSADNSDLGPIQLSSVSQLLEEVLITGRIPVVIKGDTTEYDASSFKVEKNAKVEDLLKVLPGISVDASGKITAQGKTVQKVLVDGEEFFGDDPTLVTRNIRSDMVDKVQVYEKKSEQAERTGVDDGQKEQTINVKLKDGAKNGVFGKALAGAATDGYYAGQLMVNKFKGSQKISAFGLTGNNGSTGMSWQDAEKYGGDGGAVSDGENFYYAGVDEYSGTGSIGRPRVINSGVNFSDKWKEDKHKLNVSYKYGRIEAEGTELTNMQNNLEEGILYTDRSKDVQSDKQQQRANLRYDVKIDTSTTLTLQGNAGKVKNNNSSLSFSDIFDQNRNLLSTDSTFNRMETISESLGLNLLLTKKFKKEGRSLSLNAFINTDKSEGDGHLNSRIREFDAAIVKRDTVTDQRKENKQENTSQGASVSYTEPLSKALNLSLSYGLNKTDNNSSMLSFNRDVEGGYSDVDDRYSNLYNYDRLSNNYNVGLNYNVEKMRVNLTNSFNDDQLKQTDRQTDSSIKRSFFTYNPNLSVRYNISKAKGFSFNYSGRNRLPSLTQIQPFRDNSDYLNQVIGNENLRPSFQNSFDLNYHSFKVLTGSYVYAGLNVSTESNAIVQNIVVDGVRTNYRYENLEDHNNTSANLYAGYSFKAIKKLSIENRPNVYANASSNYNFVDGALNQVQSYGYGISYSILRNTKKGLDFDFALSPGYQILESSLQPEVSSNGFRFGSNGNFTYYLPKKFKVYVNYNYTYEAPTKAFVNDFEQFLIHPGVSKKFLSNESLELDFTVNDIFNQNKGFQRSQSNSIFTQRRYDTIQRYYMLKLSWDFTKMFVN